MLETRTNDDSVALLRGVGIITEAVKCAGTVERRVGQI